MIEIQVSQILQGAFKAAYQILSGKQIIGEAHIDKNTLGGTIFYQQGEEEYQLVFDRKAGNRFYSVIDSIGLEIGRLERKEKKGSFFKPGYFYTRAALKGRIFHIYEVAMGKEGIYYPCYEQLGEEEEIQVGLIHRAALVVDLKETYDCYVKDEENLLITVLFALYNDFWNFGHTGQVAKNTKQVEYFYTFNKKLKAKYDPDFVRNN